jgi:hypothetical protein
VRLPIITSGGIDMHIQADWSKNYRDSAEIEKDLGIAIPYEGFSGWIEQRGGDTILVEFHVEAPTKLSREGGSTKTWYRLHVWNNDGVRAEIAVLLGLEVFPARPAKKKKKKS